MTAPDRAQAWIVDGDSDATLALLMAAKGLHELDEVDRVRAVWWLRRFAAECQAPGTTELILADLDPDGSTPAPMTVPELRFWTRTHLRNWGAGTRLAKAAGIASADISRLMAGRSLGPDKLERLNAAILSAGRDEGSTGQ